MEKIIFELLYPIYLMKFRKEKQYIAERLKKANLQIRPKDVYKNLFQNGLASRRYLQGGNVHIRIENFQATQVPIVFASIHLGAFEILHRWLSMNYPINLIVSEFRNKKLDAYLTKTRATENVKIIKDYEVSKILKDAIRNKEILATMLDQSKSEGEFFKILGGNMPLFFKLPLMANRMGASLVFFRTFRKNGEHVIHFERVYPPKSEIDKSDLAKMIESWILEYPEQWTWNYSHPRVNAS